VAGSRLRGLRVVPSIVRAAVSLAAAAFVLWPGSVDLNVALRGGIAAFFAGGAVMAFVHVLALRAATPERDALALRTLVVYMWLFFAGSILVGMGALWYGGVLGFIGAYAAFAFAWAWFWLRKGLSRGGSTTGAGAPVP
jgi:hypothetical protein